MLSFKNNTGFPLYSFFKVYFFKILDIRINLMHLAGKLKDNFFEITRNFIVTAILKYI